MKKLLLVIGVMLSLGAQAAAPTATLTWDPYAASDVTLFGITGFQVQRSIQPLGTTCTNLLTYSNLATTGLTPGFTDTAQQLGKRQCYQVMGIDALGNSTPSNAAGKDFPLAVPPAATGLIVQ